MVGHPAGPLQLDIQFIGPAGKLEILPEALPQSPDLLDGFLQAGLVAGHAALVQHDLAQLDVDAARAGVALDHHHAVDLAPDLVLGLLEGRVAGLDLARLADRDLTAEIVADGVGGDEVPVGQALHQGGGPEAVGPVVGEVAFTRGKEPGNGRHQVVVDPEPAHGVVRCRIDLHRLLVGADTHDVLVHVEEVAVALLDDVPAEAVDGIGEVEVDPVPGRGDSPSVVTGLLGRPAGNVPRGQVAETGVLALKVVVTLRFRNIGRLQLAAPNPRRGFAVLRNPDPAVVAERLGHEGQLRLVLPFLRDAGRVDLRVTGIGEAGPAPVGPPGRGDVASGGVGGKEEDGGVAPGRQDHGIRRPAVDLAGDKVAGDDPLGHAVNEDDIQHLVPVVHLHLAEADLPAQALVGPDQQLLAGLAAGVEGPADLRPAKGTVGQHPAVLAGKGDALGDALVDDVAGDFRQAVDIRFPAAEVAPLDRVVEEAEDAVAVVLVVLGRVDTALGRDGVRPPGGILVTEALHVVAHLAKRGGGAGTGQAAANDNDAVFALVGRVDQLVVEFRLGPLLFNGTVGDVCV